MEGQGDLVSSLISGPTIWVIDGGYAYIHYVALTLPVEVYKACMGFRSRVQGLFSGFQSALNPTQTQRLASSRLSRADIETSGMGLVFRVEGLVFRV